MDLATLVPLMLKASVFLTVIAIGLTTTPEDAVYLFKRPGLLFRTLLSMNVIMPVVAILLWYAFAFPLPVKIALVCLAISPVPPILPKKGLKAGARASYVIGLLVSLALLSIVTVPLGLYIVGRLLGWDVQIGSLEVAKIVGMTVLLPLGIGILIHQAAPAFAEKIARPVSLVSTVALFLGILAILFVAWPAIWSLIGSGGVLAIVIFVAVGLAVGHFLGGPDSDDRSMLAIATATRHPGVALAVAHANAPHNKLVLGAILLTLLVNLIVSMPYVNWRKRQHTVAASAF